MPLERTGTSQNSECHRQVERRALFAGISRGEIDSDLAVRELETGVANRRLHPVERFTHRAFGQADHAKTRSAAANIDLDFDREGVDAGEGAGHHTGKQSRAYLSPR